MSGQKRRVIAARKADRSKARTIAAGRKRQATVTPACRCMTEDPGDGLGERVVTHSSGCPLHPESDA